MLTRIVSEVISGDLAEWVWSREQLAPLALALAGIIVVSVVLRRRLRQTSSANSAIQAKAGSSAHDRLRGERELGELMIELDQLARDIHGRLDTRFAKLEAVIRDADDRIAQLRRLLRAERGESTLDVTVGDAAEAGSVSASAAESGLHADVYQLADAGRSILEISEGTGRPRGEIELILALRRARQRSAAAVAAGNG